MLPTARVGMSEEMGAMRMAWRFVSIGIIIIDNIVSISIVISIIIIIIIKIIVVINTSIKANTTTTTTTITLFAAGILLSVSAELLKNSIDLVLLPKPLHVHSQQWPQPQRHTTHTQHTQTPSPALDDDGDEDVAEVARDTEEGHDYFVSGEV